VLSSSRALSLVVYLIFISGLQIRCKPVELSIFNPPPGQSCATWANDFVDAFGGYLENPGDTQDCRYCQYKVGFASGLWCLKTIRLTYNTKQVGDEYIKALNMGYDNRWKDAWIIFAFFGEH